MLTESKPTGFGGGVKRVVRVNFEFWMLCNEFLNILL